MSASMLAAIFRDGDIKVIEVERPKPGNGEALLQIEAAAICATDIKIWQRGHRNIAIGSDAILGHEVVGKIVSLGEGLDSNLLGKRFVVAPNVGCGICKICQKGWDSLCLDYRAFGVGLDGGFAQYMLIPSSALHRSCLVEVPLEVTSKMAVLTESAACCLRGLQACSLSEGESVLIFGAGPMGILTLILAQAMGAGRVIMADPQKDRREKAISFGASSTIDPSAKNFQDQLIQSNDLCNADVVMVTAPVAEAQNQGILSAAVGGRINLFAGVPQDDTIKEFPGNLIHYRGLNVLGTTGATPIEMGAVLAMIAAGRLDKFEKIVTGIYPLHHLGMALEEARAGKGLKVIVLPEFRE